MCHDNRANHALYDPTWTYDGANRVRPRKAETVSPWEYTQDMADSLCYRPECYTPVSRSPKNKDRFSNGCLCCFVHRPAYREFFARSARRLRTARNI